MAIELYNAGTEPIIIRQNETTTVLQPCETSSLDSDNDEVTFQLCHVKNDKFNSAWYLLNELFTLEQMRTVLVVDGEYTISPSCNKPLIRVKSYEYVFDKNTSYQTFVFSDIVQRNKLSVANENKILKRSKFLYLFGGSKTLFPLTGIAWIAWLVQMLLMEHVPAWYLLMMAVLTAFFILYFAKYIKSILFLRNSVKEESIFAYLSSPRKEYRKFSDELSQKYLDVNSGTEIYR